MKLIALGLNHKTSSIDIREKFYLTMDERELFLTELKLEPLVMEAFVISTCNRTEVYALMSEIKEEVLFDRLCSVKKISASNKLKSYFYAYYDKEAVRHLLNVTAGLDSLVIGEKEVLGQVKVAIELAQKKQTLGRHLNILCNIALRTGKKARSETAIGIGGSSVSWAAVEMAKKELGSLNHKSVLIIGAGKMSQLAAGDFKRKGVEQLFVMNRTKEKGEALAEKFEGQAVSFFEMEKIFQDVDVCICSASAPHYLIDTEIVAKVMKNRQKELLFVDISMPRNIDPKVNKIKGVRLVSLDELDQIVAHNVSQRLQAVRSVEEIIIQKCHEFYKKIEACLKVPQRNIMEALSQI